MIKYKYGGIIGRIAHCKECGWYDGGYREALTKAKKHSKETGHSIAIETTTTGRVVNNSIMGD